MRVIPLTLKQANALVDDLHRHHKPVRGHRFSLGLIDDDEILRGSVICGRPVARGCDPYLTLEVTRLVTDGTRNACSILYAAAARTAQAMGFDRIQTYTLETEDGASLRGSGWVEDGLTAGGQWDRYQRQGTSLRPAHRPQAALGQDLHTAAVDEQPQDPLGSVSTEGGITWRCMC